MKQDRWLQIVYKLLLIAIVVVIVSGLGITEFRLVSALTFGLLGKNLSFKIHAYSWLPFTLLLITHVILIMARNSQKKR